jgi:uncharacterized damage-inducible protein DinB
VVHAPFIIDPILMIPLLHQIQYNRWANHRILDAVSQLSPEEFTRNLESSFSSIRDTLVHILWAEWLWLERWQGKSPQESFDPGHFPSVHSIRQPWADIEVNQVRFLEQLAPGQEKQRLPYTNQRGEKWEYSLAQMVQHVTVHSAYHRGQVTTLLRQLGRIPPMTDYLVFIDMEADSAHDESTDGGYGR